NVDSMLESKAIDARQLDPAELSPGEFAHVVRRTVDENKASVVVIDSLNGYMNAMPNERFLALHLHELLAYLSQPGVTSILLMAQHGLVGADMQNSLEASYLADIVLLLRYFESFGEVRKAISVIKKRTGRHETTIRELTFNQGITIGPPVNDFQ